MDPLQNFAGADASVQFALIIDQLLSSARSRVMDRKVIDASLTKLNSFDYRTILINNNNAVALLVDQLCTNIRSEETTLVKNFCHFIANITIAGANFAGRTFSACSKWLLEALDYSEANAKADILTALHSLLSTGPFDLIVQNLSSLWTEKGILTKLVRPSADNDWSEINFLAVSCFEAVLLNREGSNAALPPKYGQTVKDIVLHILSSLSYDRNDKLYYNKMICCCLRILCKLISSKLIAMNDSDNIGNVLGIVKAFLFHGIKGYGPLKPQILRPAAMNLPESVYVPRRRNLGNKGKSKRSSKNKSLTDEKTANQSFTETSTNVCKYSSDSDTESLNSGKTESKVRLEAIHLLHAACLEISARDMFGYWPQIVASGTRDSARVLTRSVLDEPVSKVRQCVLGTLSKLLIGARHFLTHADDSEHPSFLTFFGTVGAMIRELHFTLSLILSYEKNILVLTHALKCANGLVHGTCYARLKDGLATKLLRNCRPHVLHKDPTIRVSALTVFETLASHNTHEILEILQKNANPPIAIDVSRLNCSVTHDDNDDQDENKLESAALYSDELAIDSEPEDDDDPSEKQRISWLLQICLTFIKNETEKSPVRLEALKLVGALDYNFDCLVLPHLEIVAQTLATVTRGTDVQVARHACRVIETIAARLATFTSDAVMATAFWNIVFDPIMSLGQNAQSTLREAACDCFGNIGSVMFFELPREKSVMIITMLFGGARDDESAVRAAAVRALGMLVTLPALEEDTGFLMDLADIVCLTIDDPNLGVRVKVAWALANLCNCLINREDNGEAEPVPLDIILPRLYSTTVKAAEDNCKVKCNAVRAVGSVIRLCSDQRVIKDASRGLEVLIKCATLENDMKVRWNACRALGFVIGHNPDAILPLSWRDQVFPTLCDLVCHSPNFKVRTNAAWAIAACDSYSKYIPSLWKSVVVALENSQHVPSFVEYPHRDVLVQQLCLTLSHLASHTDYADLQPVWTEIHDHIDDITTHMNQLQDRVLPEKADGLVEARNHLNKLTQNATSRDDRTIAKNLADLFERTNRYDEIGRIANKN